ncbi:YggT family protein [Atopococcus tabaci]|uniref:YggT family protein n=1 Tax=Atopococcus tabaci TaxID=269774 RepID=UPI0004800846|nr:YggT family protein [Atopococcus tabaci]
MLIQFLYIIFELLIRGIDIYRILLMIYFLLSWIPGAYDSSFGHFLGRICEPYVAIFRRFIPPIGMISFAGLVAFLSLSLVERGLYAIFGFLFQVLI